MSDINTTQLTIDIFEAEGRFADPENLAGYERSLPQNSQEVLQQYADLHFGGDTEQLGKQLDAQRYRVFEVVNKAKEDPYSYNDYTKLEKLRTESAKQFKAPEKVDDYKDLPIQIVGESGVFYDDVADEDRGILLMSKEDPGYAVLEQAANKAWERLSDAQRMEVSSYERGHGLNPSMVGRFAEENLRKKGILIGAEGYDDLRRKEIKRVTDDLIMASTTGKFMGAVRMASRDAVDMGWLDAGVADALSPQVHLLGIGQNGQIVALSESSAKYGMETFDLPKRAFIGAVKEGPWYEAVGDRADFVNEGWEIGEATGFAGAKYVGGFFGFIADMAFPDMAAVAGAASKGVAGAAKAMGLSTDVLKSVDAGKRIAVATQMKDISKLLNKAAADGDRTLLKEATARMTKLRDENPQLARELDRFGEGYSAYATEQALKILDDPKVTDAARKEAKDILTAAGVFKLKKVTSKDAPDLAGLHKGTELRLGKRREAVKTKTIERADDITMKTAFQHGEELDAIDRAEEALKAAGEYRTTARQVGEAFRKQVKKQIDTLADPDSKDSKAIAKSLKRMAKESKQIEQELLKVVEARAGIGNHDPAAVRKASDTINKFMAQYMDAKYVDAVMANLAKKEAQQAAIDASNAKRAAAIRDARKTQRELDAQIKAVQERLLNLKKEGFVTEQVVKEAGLRSQGMDATAIRAQQVMDAMAARQRKLFLGQHELLSNLLAREMGITQELLTLFDRAGDAQEVTRLTDRMALLNEMEALVRQQKALAEGSRVVSIKNFNILKKYVESTHGLLRDRTTELNKLRRAMADSHPAEFRKRYTALKNQAAQEKAKARFFRELLKEWSADLAAVNKQIKTAESTLKQTVKARKSALAAEVAAQAKKIKPDVDVASVSKQLDDLLLTFADKADGAVDGTFDYFYKEGKLAAALKQLQHQRTAITFNVKLQAKMLDMVADRLASGKRISANAALDTARTREVASRKVFQELIKREPTLDPGIVPSVLNMLATKYNTPEDAIMQAIKNGTPLEFDGVVLDANYLAKQQLSADHAAFVEARRESPLFSLKESWEGLSSDKPLDIVDRYLHISDDDSALKRTIGFSRSLLIGGEISPDLINLSVPMKEMVQRIPRAVSQIIGDTVKLLDEKDFDGLITLMSGKQGSFSTGRPILSSGMPSIPMSISMSLHRMIEGLRISGKREKAALIERLFAQPLNPYGLLDVETLRKATGEEWYEQAADALADLVSKGKKAKVNEVEGVGDKVTDIKMPRAIIDALEYIQADYGDAQTKSVETLSLLHVLYNAGKNTDDTVEASKAMVRGIQQAYGGASSQRGAVAVFRAMPIFAAHTKAASVMHDLADVNFMLSPTDFKNWRNYVEGHPIPMEWRQTVLQPLIDLTGDSTMFKLVDVLGESKYIPAAAEQVMNQAISRARDGAVKLLSEGNSASKNASLLAQNIVTKTMAMRVTGAFLFRSKFGLDMIFEGFNNAFQLGGLKPATLHTVRMFSQVPAMFPGTLQVSHVLTRPSEMISKFGGGTELDGAPALIKNLADYMAANAGPEAFQRKLGSMGDAAANTIAKFIGAGKWQPDVNKMLAGSDELVQIGDKTYSYKKLRQLAVEEGALGGSFQANYLASHVRKTLTGFESEAEATSYLTKVVKLTGGEIESFHKLVASFAETLGERERMSMFASFISSGYSPVEAAKMTRDVLHDYQTTMSDIDYAVWFRAIMPFWGFTKNNTRLHLNSLFDPINAYRAGIARNGAEAGVAFMQQAVNDVFHDEIGVQTHLLPDEKRERYEFFKASVLQKLGQTSFTQEQRVVLRMYFLGATKAPFIEGQRWLLRDTQEEIRAMRDALGLQEYILPNPAFFQIAKPHQRDRIAFIMPQDLGNPDMKARRAAFLPAVYNYLALPELGQNAMLNHVLSVTGAAASLAMGITTPIHNVGSFNTHVEAAREQVHRVASLEFMPLNAAVLQLFGANTEEGQRALRISPRVYKMLNLIAPDLVWEAAEKSQGGVTTREKRYYMSSFAGAFLGMVPVGAQGMRELSALTSEKTGASGEPVYDFTAGFLRAAGLQIERSDTESVMRMTQQKFERRTATPPNPR